MRNEFGTARKLASRDESEPLEILKKTLAFSNLPKHLRFVFEFDSHKSESNQSKHGIDFIEAQGLWTDPRRIEVDAQSHGEPRAAIIAKVRRKIWFGVYTMRAEKIRIISVRRARKKEEN